VRLNLVLASLAMSDFRPYAMDVWRDQWLKVIQTQFRERLAATDFDHHPPEGDRCFGTVLFSKAASLTRISFRYPSDHHRLPLRNYDERESLAYAISSICPVSADGEQGEMQYIVGIVFCVFSQAGRGALMARQS
jgi:hypothetical protein